MPSQSTPRTRKEYEHRRQNSTPIREVRRSPSPPDHLRNTGYNYGLSLDDNAVLPMDFSDNFTFDILDDQNKEMVSNFDQQETHQKPQTQVAQQSLAPALGIQNQTPTDHSNSEEKTQQQQQPSEQQLKELEVQIKAVYGANSTVYVTVLPTPEATPQKRVSKKSVRKKLKDKLKPARLPDDEVMEAMIASSNDMFLPRTSVTRQAAINLDNSFSYESSYYSSDTLSPNISSCASPEDVEAFFNEVLNGDPQGSVPSTPSPRRNARENNSQIAASSPQLESIEEIDMGTCVEETGISPEAVQAYIGDQDESSRKWVCLFPGCDKTFGRKENIRSHVQTHLGDRQYKCNGCGKCFVRQHDLKRHAKIHTGDKPHKCPCGADFARQDALTRHRQRGVCIGGFPDVVRRQAKRGRPRKQRPDLEERVIKSSRTKKAIADAETRAVYASMSDSSLSPTDTASPPEFMVGLGQPNNNDLMLMGGQLLGTTSNDFTFSDTATGAMHASQSSASYGISSRPLTADSLVATAQFDSIAATDNLFKISADAFTHTPPTSPETRNGSFADIPIPTQPIAPLDFSKVLTHVLSTPPRSPVTAKSTCVPASLPLCNPTTLFEDWGSITASNMDRTEGRMFDENTVDVSRDGQEMSHESSDLFIGSAPSFAQDEGMTTSMEWVDAI